MENSKLSIREEANLIRINYEISKIAPVFKLSKNMAKKVFGLYLKAERKELLRRKKWETVFAACLYVVIRREEIPRTITDVTRRLDVSLKKIERLSKILVQGLEIKFPPVNISSFIDRFCFELNLSDEVKSKAEEILKKATKAELTNRRGPIGTAAAVIYIAALLNHEHRTQKEVSDITGVTIVTIRNIYKEIEKGLDVDALS